MDADLEKSKIEITNLLESLSCERFGIMQCSYFQTLNSEDDAVKKAVDILSDNTFDQIKSEL